LQGHNLIAVCDGSKNTAGKTLGRRLATGNMANTAPEYHLRSLSDVINASIANEIYSSAPQFVKAEIIGARILHKQIRFRLYRDEGG
jgi:hypothetical protein